MEATAKLSAQVIVVIMDRAILTLAMLTFVPMANTATPVMKIVLKSALLVGIQHIVHGVRWGGMEVHVKITVTTVEAMAHVAWRLESATLKHAMADFTVPSATKFVPLDVEEIENVIPMESVHKDVSLGRLDQTAQRSVHQPVAEMGPVMVTGNAHMSVIEILQILAMRVKLV